MTTFSPPRPMLVWPADATEPHEEICDGYDLLRSWYDGFRNRCTIQPYRYPRDEYGVPLPYAILEAIGGDYDISHSHPLCPA
jgi:hypothetical protein